MALLDVLRILVKVFPGPTVSAKAEFFSKFNWLLEE
jgi:hypothetical protein